MITLKNYSTCILINAILFFMCSLSLAFAQTGDQQEERNQQQIDEEYVRIFMNIDHTNQLDIWTLLKQEDNFSMFVELLENAGLDNSLEAIAPVTIFAPINQAFEALSTEEYDRLTRSENKANLNRILQAHFLPSLVYQREFQENQTIRTGNDEEIPVSTKGTVPTANHMATITIGGSNIVKADIEASNGIIHVIDGIIYP